MSTANKLNYLLETKEQIKDALIEKGVEVLETDTFRSYADKIRTINTAETNVELKAYIEETDTTTIITGGEIFDSSVSLICNGGTIESITLDGANFEGNNLNMEGTYTITVQPQNGGSSYSLTIIIDTSVPILQIDGNTIIDKSMHASGAIITLKDGKGIGKFAKALLYKCNSSYEIKTEVEPIDIRNDLINGGYTPSSGLYKIILMDKNDNQIEAEGAVAFRIR